MFGKKDPPSRDNVTAALDLVIDPVLKKGLGAAGFVKDVLVEDDRLRLGLELPTPAWEPKEALEREIRAKLGDIAGKRRIEIAWGSNVKSSRPEAAAGQNLVPGARNIILFASGKGGVGKSTIATNVAAALSNLGANVGLLDADIYGPSIPTMFGTRQMPQIAPGGAKLVPIHQHGLKLMSIGFVVDPKEAMSWRGPMLNGALIQFMRDVDWGDLDYLVLDLPPGTGDVQLTIAQNVKVSGACLVTTPQEVALADVVRAKSMFDRTGIPTLGIVENMSWFECGNCGTKHTIFSQGGAARLSKELGVPLLGEVPLEMGVRAAGDAGKPEALVNPQSRASQAFFALARRIATQLAEEAAKNSATGKPATKLKIVQ